MNKNTIIITLFYIINETCFAATPNILLSQNQTTTTLETDSVCRDTNKLVESLHIQRLYLRDESEAGFEAELLKSLDIEILQHQGLYLVNARRISRECAGHLDDVDGSIFHFDTNITLTLTDEGDFVPHARPYRPRFIIGHDDIHPERMKYYFIEATEVGYGNTEYKDKMTRFIAVWTQNEKSVITPYKKDNFGEFIIYDDLILFKNKTPSIRFFPHLHNAPSGHIKILLQDGRDRISLGFNWWYADTPFNEPINYKN